MIELQETITITYNEVIISYNEVFYLDYEVDEDTGRINKDKKLKYYTKSQLNRNLKSLKSAYLIVVDE